MKKNTFEPSKEWVEKQKDEKFQNLFKELWPNVYSRIQESEEKPKISANEFIKELEKNRAYYEQKVKDDLKYTLPKSYTINNSCCNNLHSCNCLKVCQVSSLRSEKSESPKKEQPKIEKKNYPNTVSSYDFPWHTSKYSETLVKSSYNPNELELETKLLKNIQESQDKLKEAQKLEKTTDLVDDMINKFKLLQDEMKKKSQALKLKSELEDLKKDIFESKARSRSASKNRKHKNSSSDTNSDRSLSRERNYSKTIIRPSTSNYSILKTHSPILCSHSPVVSNHGHYAHLNSRKSFDSTLKCHKHVKPRVKCWNCNCEKKEKHDMNIY